MKRRSLPAALLGLSAIATIARAQPSYTVSAGQLQQAVATRFPMQRPVSGLFTLSLLAPVLRLLPERNRIGAAMVVGAAGPALRQSYSGDFDVDFALRYEASDQTLRAHQLHFNSLRLSGLPPQPAALIEAYGPSLAQQSLQEVVLHKLQPQDLALADTMGFEPGRITVTESGITVEFAMKAAR
jgi:hypothetical protein